MRKSLGYTSNYICTSFINISHHINLFHGNLRLIISSCQYHPPQPTRHMSPPASRSFVSATA